MTADIQQPSQGRVAKKVEEKVAEKAAGKAAQAAVAAGTGGVGAAAAPVVGKVAEIAAGEGIGFFKKHPGILVAFIFGFLLGPLGFIVTIPAMLYAAIIYLSDHA